VRTLKSGYSELVILHDFRKKRLKREQAGVLHDIEDTEAGKY
jgi:hypothetical protein